MRKGLGIVVLLFISIWICASCKSKTEDSENMEITTKSLAVSGLEVKLEKGVEIVRDASLFIPPKENQEYQEGFDHQYWFSMANMSSISVAETMDSCYLLAYGFLYAYDKESNQAALLCHDPTCQHEYLSDCNALISSEGSSFLRYYNGYLYTLVTKEESSPETKKEHLDLYRMSLDGTTREFVCRLATSIGVPGSQYNIYNIGDVAIHRGYLYYIYAYGSGEEESNYYVNKSNVLYRIALEQPAQPEAICAMEPGGDWHDVQLQGHGSYLYFNRTGKQNELYRYNTESNQLEYMDVTGAVFYAICNDRIIYYKITEPDRYFYYDMKSREHGIFYQAEENAEYTVGYLVWDGIYFNRLLMYKDCDYILICDENLNEITRYASSTKHTLYFYFRDKNIAIQDLEPDSPGIWRFFDKDDFSQGEESMKEAKAFR